MRHILVRRAEGCRIDCSAKLEEPANGLEVQEVGLDASVAFGMH